MGKRRTRQPLKAVRALEFPLWALLVLDTQDALPLPLLSQRDSQVWMHVERTEPEALAALRTHKTIRRAHPHWWTEIRGVAFMRMSTLEELRGLALQITPYPDGANHVTVSFPLVRNDADCIRYFSTRQATKAAQCTNRGSECVRAKRYKSAGLRQSDTVDLRPH